MSNEQSEHHTSARTSSGVARTVRVDFTDVPRTPTHAMREHDRAARLALDRMMWRRARCAETRPPRRPSVRRTCIARRRHSARARRTPTADDLIGGAS